MKDRNGKKTSEMLSKARIACRYKRRSSSSIRETFAFILPRTTLSTQAFFKAFYRSNRVNETLRELGISEEYLLSKKFEMKEDGGYKIPLKSHRVWVTSPINPREIKNVLTNQFLQDSIFNTNRVLDEAAAKVKPGEKWEHYIWVNDKSLIP